ncbi:hypothetical protein [Burkholderia sp. 22PA0106]|uniref:hypothetical protein n=1 Tax=Burkholderia sp. 22PA0106 TaxID=3237371 RepID=UPI0039C48FB2
MTEPFAAGRVRVRPVCAGALDGFIDRADRVGWSDRGDVATPALAECRRFALAYIAPREPVGRMKGKRG